LLITANKRNNLRHWQATWDLAQMLHSNYSQPDYFLLEPPQAIALDEKWATRLNAANLYRNGNHVNDYQNQPQPPQQYQQQQQQQQPPQLRYLAGTAIVQKVRPAPVPSLLYGTSTNKDAYFWDHFENELLMYATDRQAFAQTLLDQIELFLTFVRQNPQFACLLCDFQVLIDKTGTFHPLDLDRCILRDGTIRELKINPKGAYRMRVQQFQKRIVEYFNK
jgi:hypothetical protein